MAGLLDGKVIFLTGGSTGIGKATAEAIVREGGRIAIADRNEAAGEANRDALKAKGADAIFLRADVADEDSVKSAIAATLAHFGTIDGAFNNAGISPQSSGGGQPVSEMTLEGFQTMLNINLTGVFLCLKHELRAMLPKMSGAIVNTASIAGLKGLPTAASYTASKHGVVGLTKTAAMEYARANIRVNAICPGFVDTQMATEAGSKIDKILKLVPQRRLGTPEEISEAVVWLLSPRASFVTGAIWTLDGGLTA